MGVRVGLYMCDVVKKFTFAISSPDEFLLYNETLQQTSSFIVEIVRKTTNLGI